MREENERLSIHINSPSEKLQVRKRRAIYRCQQRGLLEVDLILGKWASENVMALGSDELDLLDEILQIETLDMLDLLTKPHVLVPEDEPYSPLLNTIKEYASNEYFNNEKPITK